MNILQIMGTTSNQYASMERYLVAKAQVLRKRRMNFYLIYDNIPACSSFIKDFKEAGGVLLSKKIKPHQILITAIWLLALIRKENIQIVHTYFNPTNYYVAFILKLLRFKSVVKTAANMPFVGNIDKISTLYKLKHQILSMLFYKTICRSQGVLEKYLELGVKLHKLDIADGGCNTDHYNFNPDYSKQLKKELQIENQTTILGSSCRLVKNKRIDLLLFQVKNAIDKDFNVHLLIAGNGPEKDNLEKLCTRLNIKNHVTFLGHLIDTISFYSAIDIFCSPSITEGMSNSILEAMSCKKAVLLSNIAPNRSIFKNTNSTFLIDYDNKDQFVQSLSFLYMNKVRLNEIGETNRKHIEENFSVQNRINKELTIYKEII